MVSSSAEVLLTLGAVFLLGLVAKAEGTAAAESARHVPGVVKVVKLFEYLD